MRLIAVPCTQRGWNHTRQGCPHLWHASAFLLATREGNTVLDPFSSSGTVPIEAMPLGRRRIGIERSKLYNEGAILRAQTARVQLLPA